MIGGNKLDVTELTFSVFGNQKLELKVTHPVNISSHSSAFNWIQHHYFSTSFFLSHADVYSLKMCHETKMSSLLSAQMKRSISHPGTYSFDRWVKIQIHILLPSSLLQVSYRWSSGIITLFVERRSCITKQKQNKKTKPNFY